MSQWYYAHNGQQNGPVSIEQLRELAASGSLKPQDLVWNQSMTDWIPAGGVNGIFSAPPTGSPIAPADSQGNPYAAPPTSWTDAEPIQPGSTLPEIPPGSDPFDAVACIKRGFTLLFRNFAILLLIGIVYFAVSWGLAFALGKIDSALGWNYGNVPPPPHQSVQANFYYGFKSQGSPLSMIISNVFSVFVMLGLKRVLLNVTAGKSVDVGMLFGEGRLLLRAIGANIVFYLALVIGLLLLVVPGVFIALRFGFFFTAIVDRNLGIKEAFAYSYSLTTNNWANVLLLGFLFFCLIIAGFLALCVGIFIAMPVVALAYVIAYRWMQYGHRAVMDYPGTVTPMLSGN